jgi:hypothetical protein
MSVTRLLGLVCFVSAVFASPRPADAHCDSLDGPVVTAAREALRTGDVDLVLIWVPKKAEQEVRAAFDRTQAVRKLGDAARELADQYFFETVVRIHRVAEGAAYTGLAPAGRDLGPAIPAADAALAKGKVQPVVALLTGLVADGVREHFARVHALRGYKPADVAAGREYVAAYVAYIHFVERIYEAANRPAEHHYPEAHEHADR